GQYDWTYRRYDAECWADYYGIPFREPPTHDFDFKLLVRAATASRRLGRAAEYGWRLCAAVYGSDVWPVDEAVCVRIAEEVGLPGSAFVSALADPETARLAACGRGVPTWSVRGPDLLRGSADVLGQRPHRHPAPFSEK